MRGTSNVEYFENDPTKLLLRDAIFFATCLATLRKEIHRNLHETCYMLQSRAATCSGLKTSLQLSQKVEQNSTLYNSCKSQKVLDINKLQRCHLHAATYLQRVSQRQRDTSCKKIAPWLKKEGHTSQHSDVLVGFR